MMAALLVLMLAAASADASALDGRVVEDHTGAPLASVEVRVSKLGATGLIADLETDNEGRFRVADLAAGEYGMEVSKANYVDASVRVRVAGDAKGTEVRLVRCGVVDGRVLDQQGNPLVEAYVYAMPKTALGGRLRENVRVDDRGHYRLHNLAPGQYVVAVSYGASALAVGSKESATVLPGTGSGVLFYPDSVQPRVFTISGGEEFRDVDFTVQPVALYSVTGKVEIALNRGAFWLALASLDQPSISAAVALTNPDGSFHFEGIPPGAYHLFASGPSTARGMGGGILGEEPLFARTRVDVSGQNVEGISMSPQKGRTAAFMLRPPIGACPTTAHLTLTSLEDWATFTERSTEVNFSQPAVVDKLAPGRYRLDVKFAGVACFGAAGATLDLTAGSSSRPGMLAALSAGVVRGHITGSATTALLEAVATIDAGQPMRIAFPDAEGKFVFDGLRPGRYTLATRPASAVVDVVVAGGDAINVELTEKP